MSNASPSGNARETGVGVGAWRDLPLVSVVIPAYNYAHYLEEAVESILAQDYPSIELIVLDDGSTDDTHEVLEKYDGRCYWETQENMGETKTLNKGWQMSKGQILAKLSADDVFYPDAVSTSVEHLLADPGAVLTYCDFDLMDERSRVVRRVDSPEMTYRDMVVKAVAPAGGPATFFRRDAYEVAGPWNDELKKTNDLEFLFRIGLRGRFVKIPEVLAAFRVHGESQSFREGEVRSREILRVISDYYESQPAPPEVLTAKNEALSNAHILAARADFAGRSYARGWANLKRGLRLHPKNLSPYTLRMLAYGLFPGARYGLYKLFRGLWSAER